MTKVTLRHKPISKGRFTLYLDYYPPIPNPETGKLTRREFLGLYLYEKPKAPLDKQHNRDTQALAENIRARRQVEVQNRHYGFLPTSQRDTTVIAYYQEQVKKQTGANLDIWNSTTYYLNQFFDEGVKLASLTATACNEYKEFLLSAPSQRFKKKKLSRNTALSYFNKFKSALRQAYKDGLLQKDLNAQVQGVKPSETQREYLTLEELQALYRTECAVPVVKKTAVFSALTGLRFSDIEKLTWSEVQHSGAESYHIRFRQKKTEGAEVLPVSDQAVQLLGEPGKPTDKVFQGLDYNVCRRILKKLVQDAGITKHITFHCFRHTYATLQLSLGTDIYTVSKMLGHRELKTTQVYAKVIDKAKREAAGKIKLEL